MGDLTAPDVPAFPAPTATCPEETHCGASATRPSPADAQIRRGYLWALLALTVFGGALRFVRLHHPTFWIDEGFTYWRVSGSYQDLVDILRDGGFTPLHYEAVWLLGRFTTLSPFVLRLIPAVCGTLMVPAMYFLARQLAPRPVALLTAAFVACSAYLVNYSRDAKMYMDCWLFAALHLGCLMWWLRTRAAIPWLGWVAAGLAMGGVHATSLILLAIQPVYLLTARRVRWQTGLLFLAGVLIVAAGPGGYYVAFNQWGERIDKQGWNRASGLGWVDWHNAGRAGWDYLRYPGTAFLFNWEWPREQSESRIDSRVLRYYKPAAVSLGSLFVLGLFPWGMLRKRREIRKAWKKRAKPQAAHPAPAHPAPVAPPLAASLVPLHPHDHRTHEISAPLPPPRPGDSPEPWWRSTFWVLVWIAIPLWVFHCISADRPGSPADWIAPSRELFAGKPTLVVACLAIAAAFWAAGMTPRERLTKTLLLLIVLGGVLALCVAIAKAVDLRTGSVWVPRYLAVVWPALAIGGCALLMRLPTRPLRAAAIVLLLGLNLVIAAGRLIYHTEPPMDRIAADTIAAQPVDGSVRTFNNYTSGSPLSGALLDVPGRYYLCQAAGVRLRPREFLVDNFDWNPRPFVKAMKLRLLGGTSPSYVRRELEKSPGVMTVILWERFSHKEPKRDEVDELPPESAGATWRRVSDDWYPVYKNFSWEWSYSYRRREYVKITANDQAP